MISFFWKRQLDAFLWSSSQDLGSSVGSGRCCQSFWALLMTLKRLMLLLTDMSDMRLDRRRSLCSPSPSATEMRRDILLAPLSASVGPESDICRDLVFSLSTSLTSDSLDILDMRLDALRSCVDTAGRVGTPKSVLPYEVPLMDPRLWERFDEAGLGGSWLLPAVEVLLLAATLVLRGWRAGIDHRLLEFMPLFELREAMVAVLVSF